MIRIGLRLDPLGPLLFRDGRPFDAATRASSGLPTPQTLAGALRTALLSAWDGFDASEFRARRRVEPAREALTAAGAPDWLLDLRVRGPWLALATDADGPVAPLLPTPAVLVREEEDGPIPRWARNRPWSAGLPGWREADRLPLWRDALPEAGFPGGYLTLDGVAQFLRGDCPEESHFRRVDALYTFDDRVHVAIDANRRSALDGQLFSTRRLALKPRGVEPRPETGAVFYAEILANAPPDEMSRRWLEERFQGEAIPFGGEGGRVAATRLARPVDWPSYDDIPADAPGSLWLLATPAFVAPGRALPGGLPPDLVRAAASREPLAVSGWDVALGGPRPTRYAVPAGSVYFVAAGAAASPNQHGSLCDDAEDIAQGWGFALRGVWNQP